MPWGQGSSEMRKTITLLTVLILILALAATLTGLLTREGPGPREIGGFRGEPVTLWGRGLYQEDSLSVAAQGLAQDAVTLGAGIPLLALSLVLYWKGSLRGALLLAGTLGYFLYTYVSYVFLWMYNPLFLLYVVLMSMSFFAFLLVMGETSPGRVARRADPRMPVKWLGGFLIFFGMAVGLLWLGKILQSLVTGVPPQGLDHYTTLVIQGMDLGFVVPAACLAGVLLIRKKPWGYLLSAVLLVKGFTMGLALSAMIAAQAAAGVKMSAGELVVFPTLSLLVVYFLWEFLRHIRPESPQG